MPSFILIHSGIWPQCTNVADRTGQRSDSIGRTVLQTVRPINSVCLCHCVSVCLPTLLRLHFLIDFRQKWHRGNDPKSKNEFVGINIARALTLFCPQNRHFGSKGSEHPWKQICQFLPKCSQIAGISASCRKMGSRNTIVMSDFRPEVEISQFCACTMKNMFCRAFRSYA